MKNKNIEQLTDIKIDDRVVMIYCVSHNSETIKDRPCLLPYTSTHLKELPFELIFKNIREAKVMKIFQPTDCYAPERFDFLVEYYDQYSKCHYQRVPNSSIYKIKNRDKAELECERHNLKVLLKLYANQIIKLQKEIETIREKI